MLTIILEAWVEEIYLNKNLDHDQNEKSLQNAAIGGLSISLSTHSLNPSHKLYSICTITGRFDAPNTLLFINLQTRHHFLFQSVTFFYDNL